MLDNELEVTWVDDDICVCNNCGAFADKPDNIKHHQTCKPGESERWQKLYSEQGNEEERIYQSFSDTILTRRIRR